MKIRTTHHPKLCTIYDDAIGPSTSPVFDADVHANIPQMREWASSISSRLPGAIVAGMLAINPVIVRAMIRRGREGTAVKPVNTKKTRVDKR